LPFRVFGIAARPWPLPARVVLFWNWVFVQSVAPAEVSPLLVLRSRFAVSTCPGCTVFLLRAAADDCLGYRLRPLVEFALPVEFYPATPTRPPQRSGPLMGFASLQHLRNPRSTVRGRKPARYVPPSGFGYPLGGLRPRIPCRFYFAPAALLGFTLRRFPLPEGITAFRLGRTHIPLAQRYFRRQGVRPARGASVSGFVPSRIALRSHGLLSRRSPAPPLGFAPLGL
jgi:hypothetical protein